MDILRNKIIDITKDTLGYVESEDKEEFIKGASVGIIKTLEFNKEHMQNLERERDSYKIMYESLREDIKTLNRILTKFEDY